VIGVAGWSRTNVERTTTACLAIRLPPLKLVTGARESNPIFHPEESNLVAVGLHLFTACVNDHSRTFQQSSSTVNHSLPVYES
jgi:hypothetical protein